MRLQDYRLAVLCLQGTWEAAVSLAGTRQARTSWLEMI